MGTLIMAGVSGIATILLLLLRMKKYGVSWIKLILVFFFVGIIGYLGAAFSSYLSFGTWKGIRFYGKVVFVTIALFALAKMLNFDCGKLMDYYAPIDIFALVVMKFNCLRVGCCSGIELLINGNRLFFPSQLLELLVALSLFFLLIGMEKSNCHEGNRYSVYLLIYGSTRFVFDYFRVNQGKMIYDMISIAQCFCIVIVFFGILGMHINNKPQKRDADYLNLPKNNEISI